MKDLIIEVLDGLLSLAVIVVTIGGFFIGGNANPFGDFSFGLALLGAAIAFFSMVISTGAVFTLIRIRELLEEQIYLLRSGQTQPSRYGAPIDTRTSARPASRPGSIAKPTGGSLRRCRRCNAIANQSASTCASCGAPL